MAFPIIDSVATGKNIKEIAKSKGYTASMIKDELKISDKSNVYKWYRGESLPTIDNFLALSLLFGLPINDLIVSVA